ncbi:MAG: peptidoglycan-binding protein [Acidobacteria bacterium]|nr:peptidoglycan-binding protein [Acidobacteriota bacterium]MCG3193809.1 hypothetical protein [Thermoanaerobaculia bacterium]
MAQLLKVGSSGKDVSNLQTSLNFLGMAQPVLTVDGIFGPKTKAAVVKFQQSAAVMADGIVGPQTGQAIAFAVFERMVKGSG